MIIDFGLAKALEDATESLNIASSFFAGSTRWMAPELILALVEDDGPTPRVTTYSDVYAFAMTALVSLWVLELGLGPYYHKGNSNWRSSLCQNLPSQ